MVYDTFALTARVAFYTIFRKAVSSNNNIILFLLRGYMAEGICASMCRITPPHFQKEQWYEVRPPSVEPAVWLLGQTPSHT